MSAQRFTRTHHFSLENVLCTFPPGSSQTRRLHAAWSFGELFLQAAGRGRGAERPELQLKPVAAAGLISYETQAQVQLKRIKKRLG